jgi:hypothetical protein
VALAHEPRRIRSQGLLLTHTRTTMLIWLEIQGHTLLPGPFSIKIRRCRILLPELTPRQIHLGPYLSGMLPPVHMSPPSAHAWIACS